MFTLNIQADTPQALVAQIDMLRATVIGSATSRAVEEKPARKRIGPTGSQGAGTTEASTAGSATSTARAEINAEPETKKLPEEAAAEAITYSDVQTAVTRLAAAKGRDAVMEVFEMFGVTHGSKLSEDQWSEAVAALTDKLEG